MQTKSRFDNLYIILYNIIMSNPSENVPPKKPSTSDLERLRLTEALTAGAGDHGDELPMAKMREPLESWSGWEAVDDHDPQYGMDIDSPGALDLK